MNELLPRREVWRCHLPPWCGTRGLHRMGGAEGGRERKGGGRGREGPSALKLLTGNHPNGTGYRQQMVTYELNQVENKIKEACNAP